jgi:hypothetical protein
MGSYDARRARLTVSSRWAKLIKSHRLRTLWRLYLYDTLLKCSSSHVKDMALTFGKAHRRAARCGRPTTPRPACGDARRRSTPYPKWSGAGRDRATWSRPRCGRRCGWRRGGCAWCRSLRPGALITMRGIVPPHGLNASAPHTRPSNAPGRLAGCWPPARLVAPSDPHASASPPRRGVACCRGMPAALMGWPPRA